VPISVTANTTIKAKANKSQWISSVTAQADYEIYLAPAGFVYIPGGSYMMGDTRGIGNPNELPIHSVNLDSFFIGTFEVTQGEWQAVMGSNPATGYGVGPNYPVYNVSWYAVLIYCNQRSMNEGLTPVYSISGSTNPGYWGPAPTSDNATWNAVTYNWSANGYRLPTEAEWEYAARGATNNPDYLYSGSNDINSVAWFLGNNTPNGTKPVGTKSANGLWLYDMSGNVWEWCWDWYSDIYYISSPSNNPVGPLNGSSRLQRGGAWNLNDYHSRNSYRIHAGPTGSSYFTGFRLCRSADRMVLAEGGTFNNGTSDVTLSSFYIDKYETTQANYQTVIGTNSSYFSGNPNRPVEQVSWFNAIEYCNRRSMQEGFTPCYSHSTYGTNPDVWPPGWETNWQTHTSISCNWLADGYRLPTEMEWMFTASGGNQSQGYTYSGSNNIDNVAWYLLNSDILDGQGTRTHDVGQIDPNELIMYDMSGNVYEWCWDIYGNYPDGTQTDPHGATSGSTRVLRGGSWDSYPSGCAVAFRGSASATFSNDNVGIRCVRRAP